MANEVPAGPPAVIEKPKYPLCARMKKDPMLVLDQSLLRAAVMEAPMERMIAAASPSYMRADASRLAQSMIVEMGKQPKLLAATARSLIGCLLQASSLGLQFGGPLGQAYLVPYWNGKQRVQEAQIQVGYKGFIFLGHNSPVVTAYDAHPVFEDEMDSFEIGHGTDEYVRHRPALRGVRSEANLVGCYAYWISRDGRKQVEWMTKDELLAHRDKHAATKTHDNKEASPWWQHFVEMSRKTVIRRIGKRIPMQAIQTASTLDEMADDGVSQQSAAQVIIGDEIPSLTALNAEESLGLAPGEYVKNGQVFDAGGMFVRDLDGR